jgi:hypothetical protein
VSSLQTAAFDMKSLSIVGKGYHREKSVGRYSNLTDRRKYWGRAEAFWGGIWGLLVGSAIVILPGIGALFAAGPVATWIAGALEGAVVVGGLSAVGAWLCSVGIPEDSLGTYEVSLKDGNVMLVVSGTRDEVARARTLLGGTDAAEMQAFFAETDLSALV